MKPGLAVLPLEVWADVFLSPWFTRQELAQFVNGIKNCNFAEKLKKLLHDCGKHSLGYLQIYKRTSKDQENPQREAFLAVAGVDFDFPETDMPENIKTFKQLRIRHLDDEVLNFLHKIKPLFTNVFIHVECSQIISIQILELRILFGHLLPMFASIRAIRCNNKCMEWLEREFPGTLTRAKELNLDHDNPASITSYLSWLTAPLDFGVHGPRFLKIIARKAATLSMIDAIRQNFLAATTPSTFVIFLDEQQEQPQSLALPIEFTIENAATNEQLVVRNAIFRIPENCREWEEWKWQEEMECDYIPGVVGPHFHYVEIMRHPIGTGAKVREWLNQRAYWQKEKEHTYYDTEEQVKTIAGKSLTIGHITDKKKKSGGVDQDGNASVVEGEDEACPSTLSANNEEMNGITQ